MSYAISGATVSAATDTIALTFASQVAANLGQLSAGYIRGGLTAGSNTFTAKYRVNAGTGTFVNRSITVFPLP
jgi:hypothetical protein